MIAKEKSLVEMTRIREEYAKMREKELKNYKPEPNLSKPVAYFEVDRYTQGSFMGLFVVYEFIPATGKNGKPTRKPVVEGVDVYMAMQYLEKALRAKVFK